MDKIVPNTRTSRNSTENYDIEPTGSKVLSRYLRGSFGSCHDHCKPGIKHENETKPISPFHRRSSKESADRTHAEAANSVQKSKKVLSAAPKPTTKDSKVNDHGVNDEVIKREVVTFPTKQGGEIEPKSQDFKKKSKTEGSSCLSPKIPRRRLSEIWTYPTKKDAEIEPKGEDFKSKSKAEACSCPSPRIPIRRLSEVLTSPIKNDEAIEPKGHDLKPKSKTEACSSTLPRICSRRSSGIVVPNRDSGAVNSSKKYNSKTVSKNDLKQFKSVDKSTVVSPKTLGNGKSPRKVPILRSHNSSPKSEVKSPRKSKPVKPVEEVVQEKTLHVVQLNNADQTSKRQSLASSSSEEKAFPLPIEDEISISDSEDKNVADSVIKNTKKTILFVAKEDVAPEKLKFNRGKVIDAQSEANSTRKLQFKPVTVLGEDQNGNADSNRKSLRKLDSDDAFDICKSQPAVEFVLKHHDIEEQKDPQGLINNVIKETATKLIEIRKSKVKALVGAFENLIAQNDSKTL